MKKQARGSNDDLYNETSNTVAGINTPKDHESSGPLDPVSGAVEAFVENVQHTFDNKEERSESDEPQHESDGEFDHHAHLKQHSQYDRHSY